MSPELSTAAAVVTVIDAMGGWGIGTVVLCAIILPVVILAYSVRLLVGAINGLQQQVHATEQESQKRFMSFAAKYDNNIEFVKNYEEMAGDLMDLVHVNVQAITKLVDRIDANQFCPIVRRKGDPNG